MDTINLGVADGLPTSNWADIADKLATGSRPGQGAINSHSTWLTTIDADCGPHVTPVGAIWLDGAFYFQTGATRKGRNIARDPRCAIAVSIDGADVVVTGRAVRVSNAEELGRAAHGWADQGWPATVDESGTGITAPFNAPAQGPAPWNVYRLEATSAVVAANVEPGGLTRFRF